MTTLVRGSWTAGRNARTCSSTALDSNAVASTRKLRTAIEASAGVAGVSNA